jgi:aminopeptidase N
MQKVSRLITSLTPSTYDLSLTLERIERLFSGMVTITGDTHQPGSFRLHAKDLVIESVTVNGKAAQWSAYPNDELEITADHITQGPQTIVIAFSGRISDQMHGMYPSRFTHDGVNKELLATQFESHHAREVFPCVDEPEAKATFDLTLTTEAGVSVLGNMPVKDQREENDRLITSFETSPRMSSYLLAWIVGELHKLSAHSKSGVEVNVWSTPNQPVESLSFALDIAVRTIDFFDEYFDTPYPLPKSDHVALPDFSSGAMENWGLITYRETALLADPKTVSVSSKHYIATVVAHELSHQWFGNLVTMKWWNNLWLNESFANLMEYIVVDALHPEWNIWLDYSSQETIMALRRDAIDGVQAVQTEVNHPDEISTLFDGAIVYAKGGRLLRMLQYYIGHEAFQKGLGQYFKKYAYKNTEAEDLWQELSDASGKDISDFMNTWISQSGYPVVHVEESGMRQEQFFVGSHESSTKLWPIPLGATSDSVPTLMDTASIQATLPDGERLNAHDAAHFITHYTPEHLAALIRTLANLEPIDRLQLLHEQTMLARGGVISSADLLPLITSYQNETIESVWDIIALTIGELKKFVEADKAAELALRQLSQEVAAVQFARLGWETKPDEPETDMKLRATILGLTLYGEDPVVIKAIEKLYDTHTLEELDPELRGLIISNKVRHFGSDNLIDELLDRYKTTSSVDLRDDICAGITSTRDPIQIQKLLSAMTNSDIIRSQDVFRWFVYLVRQRDSRQLAWEWMKDSWSWIETTYGGDKSFDDFPRYAATGLMTREQLEDYKAFFTPMLEVPALRRVIQLGQAEIEARVNLIERDAEAVRAGLTQQTHTD